METILAAFGGMLINLVGTLTGRVLVALGISVTSFTGFNTSLEWMKTEVLSAISGLPPELIGILGVLKVGVCLNIIVSAMLARLSLQGITSDTLKQWVMK